MFSRVETIPAPAPGSYRGPRRVGGADTLISADMTVVGNLRGVGNVRVVGRVECDVVSPSVTVDERGHVEGSILAESVRIHGSVNGRVEATWVTIASTARVDGIVTHYTLFVEPGASVEGLRPWRPRSFMEDRRLW